MGVISLILSLNCRFGNDVVSGRWVSSDRVECEVPALSTADISIEITNNGMDYTSNRMQFTVLPESNVTFVHPSFGAVGASTSVTVHGSGFVFSRSLYCRFGLLSAAMYVNSTTVVCTARCC